MEEVRERQIKNRAVYSIPPALALVTVTPPQLSVWQVTQWHFSSTLPLPVSLSLSLSLALCPLLSCRGQTLFTFNDVCLNESWLLCLGVRGEIGSTQVLT